MRIMELLAAHLNLSPSRIPTREAFGNAVRAGMAAGSSTNVAHSQPWGMAEDEFNRIAEATLR